MHQIYVALLLTVSLSSPSLAQRRRYTVTQYNEGATRTGDSDYRYQARSRFDPRSQYPTSPRTIQTTYPSSTPNIDVQYSTSPRSVEIENYSTSRSPKVSQYFNNPGSSEGNNQYHTETRTVEVNNRYPSDQRSSQDERIRNKYRRKPKQTYYPKVVTFYQKPTHNNGYEFKYVTADGVQRAERGYLSDKGVWTVEGSVTSFEDGNVAVVQSYIADGSGYKSSVRRYTPEKYQSLDDFLPWATDDSFEDNKLGSGAINSLLGGGIAN